MPAAFRSRLLAQGFELGMPTIDRQFASADGTERYLIRFGDGQTVETVWMPEGDGGESGDGSEQGDPSTSTPEGDGAAEANSEVCRRAKPGDDLPFQPGRMRGELRLLHDGAAGAATQSYGG